MKKPVMGIKERYFKFCANKNLVYTLLIPRIGGEKYFSQKITAQC